MSKLTVLCIGIIFLLFTSCNKKCTIDKAFKKEFDNCILLVQKINEKGYSSDITLRSYTFECLFAVTGYEGHVDKSNEPHFYYPYSDSIDYIKLDIQEWSKWYGTRLLF